MIKQIVKSDRKAYEIIWHDSTDFSRISPITQVYGVCFTKDRKICIVENPRGHWTLPGGTPEKGESFKQTLKREVDEEADIKITNIELLGYQKVNNKKIGRNVYQLRYSAIISKIKKQTIDPATKRIGERAFIKPEDFLKYVKWGNTGEAMLKKAVKWFNKIT